MRVSLLAMLCVMGIALIALPGAGRAQCAQRYDEAFARLPALGLRGLDQVRANAEVASLFGPRLDACEAGAYGRYIDSLRDYAREAMRADPKDRDGMLRVAIPAAQRGPARVPFEESKAAVTTYRQARSDLHAIADDVGTTALMQQLLDAFDRQGPPQSLPPPAPAAPPGTQAGTQAVRAPTTPLPPWAVISLYEMRDALQRKDHAVVQNRLEAILKWMETAP